MATRATLQVGKELTLMRKLLMLDVDGVFNVKSFILPGQSEPEGLAERETDLTSFRVPMMSFPGTFTILSSPSILERMRTITQNVDTIWFTSWFEDTQRLNQVLGFNMDFLGDETLVKDESWWKLEFLQKHLSNREIIWVDDEFGSFPETAEWAATQNGRVHLVSTKATVGLNEKVVDCITNLLQ